MMTTHKPNCPACINPEFDECEHHEMIEWLESLVMHMKMQTRKQTDTGNRIATALEAIVERLDLTRMSLDTIEMAIGSI